MFPLRYDVPSSLHQLLLNVAKAGWDRSRSLTIHLAGSQIGHSIDRSASNGSIPGKCRLRYFNYDFADNTQIYDVGLISQIINQFIHYLDTVFSR